MYMIAEVSQYVAVASFPEAWIEIVCSFRSGSAAVSPPSRRRGLKLDVLNETNKREQVASFPEAWIEIHLRSTELKI